MGDRGTQLVCWEIGAMKESMSGFGTAVRVGSVLAVAFALSSLQGCGSSSNVPARDGSTAPFDSGAQCTGDAPTADASEPETSAASCALYLSGGVVTEQSVSLPPYHRPTASACCPNVLYPPTDISCAADSDCPTDAG